MSGIGSLVILATIGFLALVAWLFTIAPITTTIMVAIIIALLVVELRRARRPNPFGGISEPRSTFRPYDVDEACPNCCRPIGDTDAVRGHRGILWHERCARQMEAAGLWNGGEK